MTSFKKNNLGKMILLANLAAMAIVLGIIESRLELFVVPGAKLGLANLVSLVILYMFSYKEALTVTIIRVVMVGLLSGYIGPPFWMGLGGGILSITVMAILKKIRVGIVLVSLMGSISHQIGQVLISVFILASVEIVMYLYIMIPLGVISGILIGIMAEKFLNHYNKRLEIE